MKHIYFIGIGGIGMSALARWFLHEGWRVAGYDLTETSLTRALAEEGALVHYTDDVNEIPSEFRDSTKTLVVFTPAVPSDHRELRWFLEHGFMVEKRSEMLGHVANGKFTMAVAGTHGKTTTTTLVAWLNRCLTGGGGAFLGGISKNFGSNLVLEEKPHSEREGDLSSAGCPGDGLVRKLQSTKQNERGRLAVEADEFDRSFLRLSPDVALVTSVDADHLDIYGSHEKVKEAFLEFIDRIKPGGAVILNKKADLDIKRTDISPLTYSLDDRTADFHLRGGDIVTPDGVVPDVHLGIPGRVNLENAVGAVAMVHTAARLRNEPFDAEKVGEALASFRGVRRRFDIYVNTPRGVYMDDYAHHPAELAAAIGSLKKMFPGRRITAIFQPHLYTRTRDFATEFGRALSGVDELILTPIYPARELPIEGVTAELIGSHVRGVPWRVVGKEALADELARTNTDVVVTFGAGNIENCCAQIGAVIQGKVNSEQ